MVKTLTISIAQALQRLGSSTSLEDGKPFHPCDPPADGSVPPSDLPTVLRTRSLHWTGILRNKAIGKSSESVEFSSHDTARRLVHAGLRPYHISNPLAGDGIISLCLQVIGSVESLDQYECLSACSDTPNCTWFSSDENSGFCGLFATCDDISTEDCAECISGEHAVQYRPCRIRKSPDTPQGKSAARQQQHTYLWLAASQEEQLILAR